MEGRGRKRFLSEEEIELWARVTRNDEPLARPRAVFLNEGRTAEAKTHPVTAAPNGSGDAAVPKPAVVAAQSTPNGAGKTPKPAVAPNQSKPATVPPHAPFDPRIGKRIARGRNAIDARLDLHGLRQQDAYVVLRRFLARCQADGLRHVLVITGKGGKPDDAGTRDFWQGEERGVLRRLVPQWLSEPSFRLHVISFTESALKHGGSGALYVTIRKAPAIQGTARPDSAIVRKRMIGRMARDEQR